MKEYDQRLTQKYLWGEPAILPDDRLLLEDDAWEILQQLELLSLGEFRRRVFESGQPFYLYALCLQNGCPFYVGKGVGNRVAAHEAEARVLTNDRTKHRCIRGIWASGAEVGYKLAGLYDNEDRALLEERQWISSLGRHDLGTGILMNLSHGGEGHAREYVAEEWEPGTDGIPVPNLLQGPTLEQLSSPRLLYSEQVEMSKLAEWRAGGLTGQAFDPLGKLNAELSDAVRKRRKLQVYVRLFDNDEELLHDSIGMRACDLVGAEKVVAAILLRIAEFKPERPDYIYGDYHRLDWKYGEQNFTKRLEWWIRYHADDLLRLSKHVAVLDEIGPQYPKPKMVEERPGMSRTEQDQIRFKNLVGEILWKHQLPPRRADELVEFQLRFTGRNSCDPHKCLVFFDILSGGEGMKSNAVRYALNDEQARGWTVDWNKTHISRIAALLQFNAQFPTLAIKKEHTATPDAAERFDKALEGSREFESLVRGAFWVMNVMPSDY